MFICFFFLFYFLFLFFCTTETYDELAWQLSISLKQKVSLMHAILELESERVNSTFNLYMMGYYNSLSCRPLKTFDILCVAIWRNQHFITLIYASLNFCFNMTISRHKVKLMTTISNYFVVFKGLQFRVYLYLLLVFYTVWHFFLTPLSHFVVVYFVFFDLLDIGKFHH